MRWVLGLLLSSQLFGATAADVARAIRESGFDRDECYRVRDITLTKEDLRIYLGEGHLIFSKPVAGKRIAAVFIADVEGGDAEVMLLPPDRAERRSLAAFTDSPNLDEHFRTGLFLFTGDDYEKITAQFPNNPANKKTPELGPTMDEEWSPVLHNIGVSYSTRLTLDLMNGHGNLFAALFNSPKLGNFDISYDPRNVEQIIAGQVTSRNNRAYFDIWTSFAARSARQNLTLPKADFALRDYRIDATVNPDLSMDVVTKVKVRPAADGAITETFEIAPQMTVTQVTVDGKPAEVLQRESMRLTLIHGGNNMFLVVPPEPLRAGREYEFEFHHSGTVIYDAGDKVLYVSARGTWYPLHGTQFSDYDLRFRYPKDFDLVTPGDVVEDKTDGDWRTTRRRTANPIRIAAFNLGNYQHARVERGKYAVDVCANRALERALRREVPALARAVPRRERDPRSDVDLHVARFLLRHDLLGNRARREVFEAVVGRLRLAGCVPSAARPPLLRCRR